MDLVWLEDFLALASAGGFGRAAAERQITQPAFGRRIAALERWAGATLVDRSTHRIRLTPAGEVLRGEAEDLVRRLALARARTLDAANAGETAVTMASTHMLASTFLPGWLARAEADTGGTGPVQLLVDTMATCERMMRAGRVALLLCHHHDAVPSPLEGRAFLRQRIGSDRLVAVSAPGAGGRPLFPLEGGTGETIPYIAFREEAGLGRIVASTLLPDHAARLRPVFSSHAALTLARMAQDGRGLAFAPLSLVGCDLEDDRLVLAGEASVNVEICLFRARARQTPAFEELWSRFLAISR